MVSTRCVVVSAGRRTCRVSGAGIQMVPGRRTYPASRIRALEASLGASRERVESKQRSMLSALQRASLCARGHDRTLFAAVHGTLSGLRTASRSVSRASRTKWGRTSERRAVRTVRGGFGLRERHGEMDKCRRMQQQAAQSWSGRARATAFRRRSAVGSESTLSSSVLHAPFEKAFWSTLYTRQQ